MKLQNRKFTNMFFKALVLLYILIPSCQIRNRSYYEFEPLNSSKKILLSVLADEVRYIRLDNSLSLGKLTNIKIYTDAIFIRDNQNGYIRFEPNGNNPVRIGSKGRGPGEYQIGKSVTVNEKNGIIYVLDINNNILVYNKNGTFVRNISLTGFGAYFDEIEFVDDNLLISEEIKFGRAKYNWIFTDTLGKVIKEKMNPLQPFNSRLGMHGGLIKASKNFIYWNIYNDTVYSIQPDMKYTVSFLFKKGDFRIPASQYDPAAFRTYMNPYQIIETNSYWIIYYIYDKLKLDLINKPTREVFSTEYEYSADQGSIEISGGITNDLDGGLPFHPESYYSDRNEYLIGWVDPFKLKVLLNKSSNIKIKYPEKKKELEKLAASLKETDNPVLVLVKLKK